MEKYAVVDIETTGLVHQGHGITEIAVVHVDEHGVFPAFHSMIDPGRKVPNAVTHLTGIDGALLRGAPSFTEKVHELLEALEGRIFVAHQVNFDYAFLKAAFAEAGHAFHMRRLCTARLARRVLPQISNAKLTTLTHTLQLPHDNPHRAMGDALATAHLLLKLKALDTQGHLMEALRQKDHNAILPASLAAADVMCLPESPGVYYLMGNKETLYVGKAVNVRRRVLSHFTSPGQTRRKQLFQREVNRVSCKPASSNYMAMLMEDAEILRLMPRYNIAQKQRPRSYAVRLYANRAGENRLAITAATGHRDDLITFTSPHMARQWLLAQVRTYGLNPRRAGLSAAYFESETIQDHNEDEAFALFMANCRESHTPESFALVEPEKDGKTPFVLVRARRYLGYGEMASGGNFDEEVTLAPDTLTARSVMQTMLRDAQITLIPL